MRSVQPRPVAGPPRSLEFDEIVAADVCTIPDLSAKGWPCLVMVDLATGVHGSDGASGCDLPKPGIHGSVGRTGSSWVMWARPLGRLLVDQGSHCG